MAMITEQGSATSSSTLWIPSTTPQGTCVLTIKNKSTNTKVWYGDADLSTNVINGNPLDPGETVTVTVVGEKLGFRTASGDSNVDFSVVGSFL